MLLYRLYCVRLSLFSRLYDGENIEVMSFRDCDKKRIDLHQPVARRASILLGEVVAIKSH